MSRDEAISVAREAVKDILPDMDGVEVSYKKESFSIPTKLLAKVYPVSFRTPPVEREIVTFRKKVAVEGGELPVVVRVVIRDGKVEKVSTTK